MGLSRYSSEALTLIPAACLGVSGRLLGADTYWHYKNPNVLRSPINFYYQYEDCVLAYNHDINAELPKNLQ